MAFVGVSGLVSLLRNDTVNVCIVCEGRKRFCRVVRPSRRCVLNLYSGGAETFEPEPEEREEGNLEEMQESLLEECAQTADDLINSPLMLRKRIEVGERTRPKV